MAIRYVRHITLSDLVGPYVILLRSKFHKHFSSSSLPTMNLTKRGLNRDCSLTVLSRSQLTVSVDVCTYEIISLFNRGAFASVFCLLLRSIIFGRIGWPTSLRWYTVGWEQYTFLFISEKCMNWIIIHVFTLLIFVLENQSKFRHSTFSFHLLMFLIEWSTILKPSLL